MNTLAKPDAPTKTLLRLRYLIPLLVLGYVVLGGFLVPNVDIAVGHLVMAGLSVACIGLVLFGFYRYNTDYRSPSIQRIMFGSTVALTVALVAVFTLHVIAFMSGDQEMLMLYVGEAVVMALAALTVLIKANDH